MGSNRHLSEGSAVTSERFVRFYQNRTGATPTQIARIEGRRKARLTRMHQRAVAVAIEVGEEPEPFESPRFKKRSQAPTYLVFRECLLRHIKRDARVGYLIRQDVSDDYGSHTERRFWRMLAHLMEERIVEKTVDGYRLAESARAGGGAW